MAIHTAKARQRWSHRLLGEMDKASDRLDTLAGGRRVGWAMPRASPVHPARPQCSVRLRLWQVLGLQDLVDASDQFFGFDWFGEKEMAADFAAGGGGLITSDDGGQEDVRDGA